MKAKYFILSFCLLCCVYYLWAQANRSGRLFIPFLDPNSQSNVVVILNGSHPQPCPLEYTNIISNTNLFSPAEREMLTAIPIKYKNVTTNSGPMGSVLESLSETTNGYWMVLFQYTNLEASDEVTFSEPLFVRFRTKSGDGYNANISYASTQGASPLYLCQIRHDLAGGLAAGFYDSNHCDSWMHLTNGLVVGRWLTWDNAGRLIIEADFNEPYDFKKHGLQMRN